MRQINLAGDPYAMGQQHGQQVRDLRGELLSVIDRRLVTLARCNTDLSPYISELSGVWEEYAQGTLYMLRGIANELGLDWDSFFRYTIASYLEDRANGGSDQQGCTTWAAGPPIINVDTSILVKNRDYRQDHQDLQCVAYAKPTHGHYYAYVTSAGSPGVFSSGMNESGLAVIDTHVHSLDLGPGLARYSLMMDILEKYDNVSSALDYLQSVPHTGNGTLIILDKSGDMAVFEIAHKTQAIIRPESGFVVSTNHFNSLSLRHRWEDRSLPELQGNSRGRYARITAS
jgi:hypothetical protein